MREAKRRQEEQAQEDEQLVQFAEAPAAAPAPSTGVAGGAQAAPPLEEAADGSLWNLVPTHADAVDAGKVSAALPLRLFGKGGSKPLQRRGSRLAGIMTDLNANAPKGSTVFGYQGGAEDPLGIAPPPADEFQDGPIERRR